MEIITRTIKCALCGREFTTDKPSEKYCINCKEQAKKLTRERWKEKTGYNKKQREKIREKRAQQRQEENKAYDIKHKKDRAKIEAAQEAERKKRQIELQNAADHGDILANLQIEKRKGVLNPNYWKWYAIYEIEYAENNGYFSGRMVNGISVYEPEFPELVIESIKKGGSIYTEKGKGREIGKDKTT